MDIREKLINLRAERNLSQQDLADLLNVSRTTVSRWEAGKNTPSTTQILNICKALGIDSSELFGEGGTAELLELDQLTDDQLDTYEAEADETDISENEVSWTGSEIQTDATDVQDISGQETMPGQTDISVRQAAGLQAETDASAAAEAYTGTAAGSGAERTGTERTGTERSKNDSRTSGDEGERKSSFRAALIALSVLGLIAIVGLIITIIYAVKDSQYDTSTTVWIMSIPQNTPMIVLCIFIVIFIIVIGVLMYLLLRRRK